MPKKPEIKEFKSHNHRRLVELGQDLFGDFWQNPMARALSVGHRQVLRWSKGEYEPPDAIIDRLSFMWRQKAIKAMKDARGQEAQ